MISIKGKTFECGCSVDDSGIVVSCYHTLHAFFINKPIGDIYEQLKDRYEFRRADNILFDTGFGVHYYVTLPGGYRIATIDDFYYERKYGKTVKKMLKNGAEHKDTVSFLLFSNVTGIYEYYVTHEETNFEKIFEFVKINRIFVKQN